MTSDGEQAPRHPRERAYAAERAKAFFDAVVAIAMTLLILPLMESVGEVADASGTTAQWFAEHHWQLVSFALSFVIIAMFWLNSQRLFEGVERVTTPLLWISMAWLLTIVWLPVATALSGRMDDTDAWAKVVYIGSMILTSFVTLVQRVYLMRHPELHHVSAQTLRDGLGADISLCVLFTVALVVAVLVPQVGYYALFLMVLTGTMQWLLKPLLQRSR